MHLEHSIILDAGLRVQEFFAANAAALGLVTQSTSKADLDAAVLAMQSHASDQDTSIIAALGETSSQRAQRLELRKTYMLPISKIAAAKLVDVPQFADLRMPRYYIIGNRFVAAATAMANAASLYVKVFTDAGLPSTVIDDFRGGIARLTTSVSVRSGHQRSRKTASQGLDVTAEKLHKAIRVLDGAVRHQLVNDPALLAVWVSTKRVPTKRRSPKPSQAPAQTTAPTPATPAAATPAAATPAAATPVAATPTQVGSTPAAPAEAPKS
jgi:hypothetical protein